MATLSPPPKSRSRANSTSLRPIQSLGRRRSTSCLHQERPSPIEPPSHESSSSMLVLFLSKLIHVHGLSSTTPDDFVLPLSDSSHSIKPSHRLSIHAPILFVILLFPFSTALVLWSLSTLPISISWPHDIADLAQLGRELHGYSQSGPGPLSHVIAVMAVSAVWKHAWSVPGSVLWNVLGGALFSPMYATILLITLTTLGSACATLLSTPLGPFITKLFPRALDMTRNALGGDSDADPDAPGALLKPRSSPWVRFSVLRLIGVVPWSGINIACGVCGVSILDCMLGTFIGCLPWTAVTCQIGDILQAVASTPSPTTQTVSDLLTRPEILFKLVFLSVISLAPILGRSHLHAMISQSPDEERQPRWTWVQEWRSKIRLPSRSRPPSRERDLDTLVDEKRRMEDLSS
ncbi:hypothetical protein M413DRAFT_441181 [Hebeloma cylindrosporum]|uniref:VTT domain-containing protein n=1 Tax=Hebeloma cylindrosporum TaxID=76867 RepID=A0A0C3CBH1_HEBCY|nr:hypothetical protein M413DRAFT_441181 [Hebeloma cylindrosporum h7]